MAAIISADYFYGNAIMSATSPQLNATHFDVCIIGAGIAGLSAAQILCAKGLNVAVLEKSRGPGGRMATRRIDGAQFNHGAPSFTLESDEFITWARADARKDSLKIAVNRALSGTFVATNSANASMNLLARSVFTPPNLYTLVRVTTIELTLKNQWLVKYQVETPQGDILDTGYLTANKIVLALPAPQAAALLTPLKNAMTKLAASVPYDPCWVAIVTLPKASDITCDELGQAAINADALQFAKCIRQSSSTDATTEHWVIYATATWTKAHLNDTKEAAGNALFMGFSKHFNLPEKPLFCAAHRWLYAQSAVFVTSQAEYAGGFNEAAAQGLFCVGDWVWGDGITDTMCSVERARVSGRRCSTLMLATYTRDGKNTLISHQA